MNFTNLTRILVTHRGGAKYFACGEKNEHLRLLESFDFPHGKLQSGDLEKDKPGRVARSFKAGTSAISEESSAVDHEEKVNAKHILEFLNNKLHSDSHNHFIVTAGPHLLGVLRKAFDSPANMNRVVFVAKDLAKIPDEEILDHVIKVLGPESQST